MKCVLIGNFGVGNLGDEALRAYFLQAFPEVTWTIVSAVPAGKNEVPRLPCGIRSLCTRWWRTVHAFRTADAVVFGGGSLFTDAESSFACFLWWWHACVARFFRKPVILAFQGIGPFRSRQAERYARYVINQSMFVSVRDEASMRRIQEWNTNKKVVQSFDPVFSLLSAAKSDHSIKNVLAIFPRDSWDETFVEKVHLELFGNPPEEVAFLLMRPEHEQHIAGRMVKELGLSSASIVPLHSLDDLIRSLAPVRRVITQRYHGAIAALALGKEVNIVSQVLGDKLDELRTLCARDGVGTFQALVLYGEEQLRMALKSIV